MFPWTDRRGEEMVVLCYRVLGFTELQDTIPVVVFHEEEEGERGLSAAGRGWISSWAGADN